MAKKLVVFCHLYPLINYKNNKKRLIFRRFCYFLLILKRTPLCFFISLIFFRKMTG